MRDLKNPKLMWLKAGLFLGIALMCGALLVMESPRWQTVGLVVVMAWACCRAYYFAFYVFEHYIDPDFRYSGLWSVVRRVMKKRRTGGAG